MRRFLLAAALILAACTPKQADGFFLFDLCYIRRFDYWDKLKLK